MGAFELILLSVGLAMDAFAVSICKGLALKKITFKECLICGLWFGIFQALMPSIGYAVGIRFEKLINLVAPWVAFILLSIIGVKMIKDAFDDDVENSALDFKTMLILAIATSIDALAVGITFVAMPVQVLNSGKLSNIIFAVSTIGIITFIISAIGVKIGNIFGAKYRARAEIAGGVILILIGLKALLSSFGILTIF